jgi:hypothetical protein
MQYTFFTYEKDMHYALPEAMKMHVSRLEHHGVVGDSLCYWKKYCGTTLISVDQPKEASFILFPHDIGWLVDILGTKGTKAFLNSLPHYQSFPEKHIFFDYADSQQVLETSSVLFKISVPKRKQKKSLYQIWYDIPRHVSSDGYVFHVNNIKYDISFIGTNTNPFRAFAVKSLSRQDKLRCYCDMLEGNINNGIFYPPSLNIQESEKRRRLFRKVTTESYSVLCFPGVGPLSVRLFETMFYGRIPILLRDLCDYPQDDEVSFSDFCIFINVHDLTRLVPILQDTFQKLGKKRLQEMCKLSCQAWHRSFSRQHFHKFICRTLARHFQKNMPSTDMHF